MTDNNQTTSTKSTKTINSKKRKCEEETTPKLVLEVQPPEEMIIDPAIVQMGQVNKKIKTCNLIIINRKMIIDFLNNVKEKSVAVLY